MNGKTKLEDDETQRVTVVREETVRLPATSLNFPVSHRTETALHRLAE